ncbi:MAG TPA: hypothetical protein VFV10_00800 [Gammaproteobacteria bacterium]|nr:hypothetical protein [Gammaproteobacteria bacterium]
MSAPGTAPRFLLIVRERVRADRYEAYGRNEIELAAASAAFDCPHPYLALVSVAAPTDVWWLNAFASEEERDGIGAAYARNEALMTALTPLGERKEGFREALTTTMTRYRADLSDGRALELSGARFLVVSSDRYEGTPEGAVFQASDGRRSEFAPAANRAEAGSLAVRMGGGATILAVQPQWSFPARDWIEADPELWSASPAARLRGSKIGV